MKSNGLAWATAIGTGLFLAAAAPTQAQDEGEWQQGQEEEWQQEQMEETGETGGESYQQQGEDAQAERSSGIVSGVVRMVDFEDGKVELANPQGEETAIFHAKPNQIAALREGELIEAPFATYGEEYWLLSNLEQEAAGEQFGRTGQTSGEITKLNHVDGKLTITIDGKTDMSLRAHPRELESLSTGQNVDVTFYRVGRNDWVRSVSMAGGTP